MNGIIKAEIKKLTKKMNATTEMESHNYYRGKIAGLKLASRLEPQVMLNFADILDDMIKELQTEQQTIQNANRDDDWEEYCYNVCDNQLKILYQLQSKISA